MVSEPPVGMIFLGSLWWVRGTEGETFNVYMEEKLIKKLEKKVEWQVGGVLRSSKGNIQGEKVIEESNREKQ